MKCFGHFSLPKLDLLRALLLDGVFHLRTSVFWIDVLRTGVSRMNLGRDRRLLPNNLRRRDGRSLLAKVPLDAEMYRQNHGDNGRSAQHQDREENFDRHRNLGYQKAEPYKKIACHAGQKQIPQRRSVAPLLRAAS
jgi:hypothetical protein